MSTKSSGKYFTSQWFGDDWIKAIIAAEREALIENAANIVRSAQHNITGNDSIFTGNLRRSIGMNQPHVENGVQQIDVGLRGGSSENIMYGLVVEHGRKAGKRPPPSKALYPWVKRKMKPHLTGKTAAARENELKGLAYVVARAIGKRGIKPKPYMKPAFDMHKANTRAIFERRLRDKLRAVGAGAIPL